MSNEISCFKAYDIRGRIPDQLNEDIAYRIGRAYVEYLAPKTVVVGYDIRLTSRQLCDALSEGLTDGGADVINIGQCGTEEIYFATSHLAVDGGIVVTASHNPKDYNGMKLVRDNSRPISGDTGLTDIKALAEANDFAAVSNKGKVIEQDTKAAYIEHLLTYVDISALKPLKIVCNAGNGGAGPIIDLLEASLPVEFIKVAISPMACPIPCWRKIVPPPSRLSRPMVPTWASPGMVISTAAFSSMPMAALSRAIILSVCCPRPSWKKCRARKWSMIHA
jgi:phosphomannomutase